MFSTSLSTQRKIKITWFLSNILGTQKTSSKYTFKFLSYHVHRQTHGLTEKQTDKRRERETERERTEIGTDRRMEERTDGQRKTDGQMNRQADDRDIERSINRFNSKRNVIFKLLCLHQGSYIFLYLFLCRPVN